MNQIKTQLAAAALLDRALNAVTDDELRVLLDKVPDDAAIAVSSEIGVESLADAKAGLALRVAASKGRVNGVLGQLGMVLSEACLNDCVEALGDSAENPTEDELRTVSHQLVASHGVGAVRLMLASAVVGEAPASVACIHLLKSDEILALPPVVAVEPVAPTPLTPAELAEREAVRARRKEDRSRKQAEAQARRDQSAQSRRKKK
jgi:hypothetical protein